ncbi:hypothetical protein VC161_17740 [Citrobacter koseri]|uniref:hypothetical protein n=1 Tax=Citrobacter koseri TaxID=545 RepID=UPI002B3A1AF8|nr:hypothetical protein [Citrobacter koseri]MEB2728982.1 hypothetical protein [Citrobacter koseri]
MRKKCKTVRKDTSKLSDFEIMGGPLKGHILIMFLGAIALLVIWGTCFLLLSLDKRSACQNQKSYSLEANTPLKQYIDTFCKKQGQESDHNEKQADTPPLAFTIASRTFFFSLQK